MNGKLSEIFDIRKKFDDDETYKKFLVEVSRDSYKVGKWVVAAIMVIELLMIGYWFFRRFTPEPLEMPYILFYIVLELTSATALIISFICQKKLESSYNFFLWVCCAYGGVLLLWADGITLLDTMLSNSPSVTVFMTITLIMPMVVYIPPSIMIPMTFINAAAMFYGINLCASSKASIGLLINIAVFSLFSVIINSFRVSLLADKAKAQFTVARQNEELRELNEKLFIASTRDSLSGLLNRNTIQEEFEKVRDCSCKSGKEASFILFDVDDFKQINDTLGHSVGDECIVKFSAIIESAIKNTRATAFRYGGEEFLIMLADKDACAAVDIAEKIRTETEKLRICSGNCSFTVSAGVYSEKLSSKERLRRVVAFADKALYDSKHNGKNMTSVYGANGDND